MTNPTNTPSPDEDRELIAGLKRATRHCDNAGAIAAINAAADRLESLLSDRAKLEEARDTLIVARQCISSFRSGAEYATQEYIDTVDCKIKMTLDALTQEMDQVKMARAALKDERA